MPILSKLSRIERAILFLFAVGTLTFNVLNFLILNKLSPVIAHLEALDLRVSALERTTTSIEQQHTDLSKSLASLTQFAQDTNSRVVVIERTVTQILLNKAK
jgi:cell division protein FtsL